jgi:hypothetical protein
MSKNDTRTINIKTCERGGGMEVIGACGGVDTATCLTDGGGARPAS